MIQNVDSRIIIPILSFLKCETSQGWIDEAKMKENLSILLIDYLVCDGELNVNMCKSTFRGKIKIYFV
jgi:tRNA isopentenyl-2-thiomethyl-A-37 hydroxylase MiaE